MTNARLFEVRPDTGGWLTVSNGRHVASIAILRGSMTASFVPAADGQGGTLILTEAMQTANQLVPLTTPHA